MADPISAGIMVGGSVIGGLLGKGGAKKAAKAQAKADALAIAEQRRQFDLARSDLAPWREQGVNALGRLGRASTGDMTDFTAAPDYEFRRTEGQRGLGNSFAARGGAFSGNAMRALDEFNQNLASGEYGNWWNRQAGLAGVGQSATNAGIAAGANSADNISNIITAGGDSRASGIINGRNALAGGINDAIYGYYRYGGNSPYSIESPMSVNNRMVGGLPDVSGWSYV